MFLVNMRIIDVKTAKIMKVVSVDIKGSIEEVVGALPGIASQLVGPAAAPAAQARAIEKRTEEKPVEKVKEEKPQAEEKKEEPAAASAPEVSDERMEKNKNRFGVRLGMNIFGVRPKRIFHYADYDTNYFLYTTGDSSIDFDNNNSGMKITRSPLINYNVKFVLKAGPVITIDIGAGYSHQETDYEGTTLKQAHAANIFSFPSFGLNFVKRWYPLKLNVGLLADFNILNYSVDYYSWDYNAASFVRDTTVGWLGLNGGFGARAGLEIMAGKHVGFNVDFVYYYSSFTTFTETIESTNLSGYTTYKSDWSWELTMPPIAVGLGVNFYF
jgi:hypothetical protein